MRHVYLQWRPIREVACQVQWQVAREKREGSIIELTPRPWPLATVNTVGASGLLRASCPPPLLHPSMGSALRASLRLFKFAPCKFAGPHFVRSKSLQAILYSRLPVLCPAGQPSAVQICSRQICRTSLFSPTHANPFFIPLPGCQSLSPGN